MINRFISKLPLPDKLIFFSGKFFNKIGSWILSYKKFGFWQFHYNKMEFQKVDIDFDGKELFYKKDSVKALARRSGSDSLVFETIIIQEEYKAAVDIFFLNKIELNTFLDLGANIGLTSVYVKKKFPNAKVIAVEPDKNNYEMMLRNFELNTLSNTFPLMAAVDKKEGFMDIDTGIRDKENWAISFKEANCPTEIVSYSIPALLNKYSLQEIDFLKMDIEGTEKAIFENGADISFLNRIKVLAVEIHDEFNCRSNIYKVLKENNFIVFNSNETTIAFKKNLF